MDQRKAEKLLCAFYIVGVCGSLITSITSGVVWGHWRWTLDQCSYSPGYNCSCILYGVTTPTNFHGGNMWTCMWIIFGPIPVILIFLSFAIYHGTRGCFGPTTEATRSIMTRNESGEVIHMQIRTPEIEPISRTYWIIVSICSTVFAVYMLTHFIIFTDGYFSSCRQYRRKVIDMLNFSGEAEALVHNRLACNAVFDFMDYLQPAYNYIERYNFINTAVALIIGIITSFAATFCLTAASIINIKFLRSTT